MPGPIPAASPRLAVGGPGPGFSSQRPAGAGRDEATRLGVPPHDQGGPQSSMRAAAACATGVGVYTSDLKRLLYSGFEKCPTWIAFSTFPKSRRGAQRLTALGVLGENRASTSGRTQTQRFYVRGAILRSESAACKVRTFCALALVLWNPLSVRQGPAPFANFFLFENALRVLH